MTLTSPLYAISSRPAESAKAERAATLLNAPDLALSVQVLQEFYVQATRSTAAAPLSHGAAVAFIDTLRRFPVQVTTVPLIQAALATRALGHQLLGCRHRRGRPLASLPALSCPRRGEPMRIIAFVTEVDSIRRIFSLSVNPSKHRRSPPA